LGFLWSTCEEKWKTWLKNKERDAEVSRERVKIRRAEDINRL
jgi:hypothetical protein